MQVLQFFQDGDAQRHRVLLGPAWEIFFEQLRLKYALLQFASVRLPHQIADKVVFFVVQQRQRKANAVAAEVLARQQAQLFVPGAVQLFLFVDLGDHAGNVGLVDRAFTASGDLAAQLNVLAVAVVQRGNSRTFGRNGRNRPVAGAGFHLVGQPEAVIRRHGSRTANGGSLRLAYRCFTAFGSAEDAETSVLGDALNADAAHAVYRLAAADVHNIGCKIVILRDEQQIVAQTEPGKDGLEHVVREQAVVVIAVDGDEVGFLQAVNGAERFAGQLTAARIDVFGRFRVLFHLAADLQRHDDLLVLAQEKGNDVAPELIGVFIH